MKIEKKRGGKDVEVTSRAADIVSDWAQVWQCPDKHLSEVVALRDDIDPQKPIAEFFIPYVFTRNTIRVLECENILTAGKLNGKRVRFFLKYLDLKAFRSLGPVFFFHPKDLSDSKTEIRIGRDFLKAFGDEMFPNGRLPQNARVEICSQTKVVRTMAEVYYAWVLWWARRHARDLIKLDREEAWRSTYWPLLKDDPKTGKHTVIRRAPETLSAETTLKVLDSIGKRFYEHPNVCVIVGGEVPIERETTEAFTGPRQVASLVRKDPPHIGDSAPPPDDAWKKNLAEYQERCRYEQRRQKEQEAEKRKRQETMRELQRLQEMQDAALEEHRQKMAEAHVNPPKSIDLLFEEDVKANYPLGFDFKETSLRLVESRIGRSIGHALVTSYKLSMFERSDGLWFFPDMILSDSSRGMLSMRAQELLTAEGAFSLDVLQEEFASELRNLRNGKDFKHFFNRYITDSIGGRVRGHEGWRTCFPADVAEEEGWQKVARRIRRVLIEAGDAISVEDVLMQLPFFDREVVERTVETQLDDVVTLNVDDVHYLKLLEYFYLPEDFAGVLVEFVHATETNLSVTSIVLLEGMLNERYGEGFRVNYGLEDESVFKQVVAMSAGLEGYEWKGDIYVKEGEITSRNVADEFLALQHGVFHEEDFFAYAAEKRGNTNRASLICKYLRPRCVRLNRTLWIGEGDFLDSGNVTEEIKGAVCDLLRTTKGTTPILHVGLLPDTVLNSLPSIAVGDRSLEWNRYLLVSYATHFIKTLNVVNDEPSPYYVTAMLIDDGVVVDDPVDYVLEVYKQSGLRPVSVDEMFDYLKEHYVRMTKTEKLLNKIRSFWEM